MNLSDPQLSDAKQALNSLVTYCRQQTGQGYKLRGLLYSLWNGKSYSLLEIICLDRALRVNLIIVLARFGANNFFYDEIKTEFVAAGLFDWFCEERSFK
jgi:hypothetical protein